MSMCMHYRYVADIPYATQLILDEHNKQCQQKAIQQRSVPAGCTTSPTTYHPVNGSYTF